VPRWARAAHDWSVNSLPEPAAGAMRRHCGTAACLPSECGPLVGIEPAASQRLNSVTIDSQVVLFLLATTLLTAVGLAGAGASASSVNLTGALKEAARSSSGGPRLTRLRGFLIASESLSRWCF